MSSSFPSERFSATKQVFLSALCSPTSSGGWCPQIEGNVESSARELVEFMLEEDKDMPLVLSDEYVKLEVRMILRNMFSMFRNLNFSLISEGIGAVEDKAMQYLVNLEWMCNILPKIGLMGEFVFQWTETSRDVLLAVDGNKADSFLLGFKVKLIQLAEKAFEAVAYENAVLSYTCRVELLNAWLPYLRKIKLFLGRNVEEVLGVPWDKMEGMWQNIEAAIVMIILTLPSTEQASIFVDWMQPDQVMYPDLSQAFELWCYRTKSANRRLGEAIKPAGAKTPLQ